MSEGGTSGSAPGARMSRFAPSQDRCGSRRSSTLAVRKRSCVVTWRPGHAARAMSIASPSVTMSRSTIGRPMSASRTAPLRRRRLRSHGEQAIGASRRRRIAGCSRKRWRRACGRDVDVHGRSICSGCLDTPTKRYLSSPQAWRPGWVRVRQGGRAGKDLPMAATSGAFERVRAGCCEHPRSGNATAPRSGCIHRRPPGAVACFSAGQ